MYTKIQETLISIIKKTTNEIQIKSVIKPLDFQRKATFCRYLGTSINLYVAPIFPLVQSSDLLTLHAKRFILPLKKVS